MQLAIIGKGNEILGIGFAGRHLAGYIIGSVWLHGILALAAVKLIILVLLGHVAHILHLTRLDLAVVKNVEVFVVRSSFLLSSVRLSGEGHSVLELALAVERVHFLTVLTDRGLDCRLYHVNCRGGLQSLRGQHIAFLFQVGIQG